MKWLYIKYKCGLTWFFKIAHVATEDTCHLDISLNLINTFALPSKHISEWKTTDYALKKTTTKMYK